MARRIIGHLDMDAFFAAIEERDNPRFRGLPIVVGADPKGGRGRGVVSTANYAARAYGIHSAQPISVAWRASEDAARAGKPRAVFLPGNWRRYSAVSDHIMSIIRNHTPIMQQRSVDEAYFDLSGTSSYTVAAKMCQSMKNEILRTESITATVGIGPNKLIAKVASDTHKPDGLAVVEEQEVQTFLEPLSIRAIPGIGPKTGEFFAQRGVKTVRDLRQYSQEEMEKMLGKWGLDLYLKIRGIDTSPIREAHIAKSVGEQCTFRQDTLDAHLLMRELHELCSDVFRRFGEDRFKQFRTVVLTVRFADFETVSRTHTMKKSAGSLKTLRHEATKLLLPFLDRRENPHHKLIRLLGVRVEKIKG